MKTQEISLVIKIVSVLALITLIVSHLAAYSIIGLKKIEDILILPKLFSHPQRKCPLCGLTRGFIAASRGDFNLAKTYNPNTMIWYLSFWIISIAGILLFSKDLNKRISKIKAGA